MSLQISGVVAGTKSITQKNNQDGSEYQRHFVGIQTDKENGYDGETIITDLAVSKAQFDAGILAYYQRLSGKVVTLPVWVSSWSGSNGKHGLNMHLGGDGKALSGEKPKDQ